MITTLWKKNMLILTIQLLLTEGLQKYMVLQAEVRFALAKKSMQR